MKIAYLGPKGSFSHHVVQTAFSHEELQAFANITDVIKAYEQGLVDYSVVPVENSIEGSVHETLDYLFHQVHIQAVAEIVQPIHQQLTVVPGHTKIEKIFSHPQALAQGKKFIDEQYPDAQIEVTASTAYAARFISEHPDQPFAAIAPRSSAEEYGLELIAEETEMPIPVGYDAYLSTAFGDYMTPPPADKQVPHHDAVIADMDKSYTEYKGEYGG